MARTRRPFVGRFSCALLRCKPPSPVQGIWTKTIVMQGSGTGGRLCSHNLRIWSPALSIELHPYIYRPQRRYAPGWIRLSGGLVVVLTNALRPRLYRRCFVLPGRLLLFTACFAAWRARPSGPDVWADALVRRGWSAPELHQGGGYYCAHIAAGALCLSLDGSIFPPRR